jgi:hypothetical protein
VGLSFIDQPMVDLVRDDKGGKLAIFFILSTGITFPVGLEGELIIIPFTLGLSFSSIISGRYWKPSFSNTSTKTGDPSTNRMILG